MRLGFIRIIIKGDIWVVKVKDKEAEGEKVFLEEEGEL